MTQPPTPAAESPMLPEDWPCRICGQKDMPLKWTSTDQGPRCRDLEFCATRLRDRLAAAESRCRRLELALSEISEAYTTWGESPTAPDFDCVSDQLGALCNAVQDAAVLLGVPLTPNQP